MSTDPPPLSGDSDDQAFLAAFEDCTLPRAAWTHANHIRMAWLQFARHSTFEPGLEAIRAGIRRYNASVGNLAYHETITVAFARLIWHRRNLGAVAQSDWHAFAAANPDLFSNAEPILARHYSRDLLNSTAARETFVAPDLERLPNLGAASGG